MADNPCNCPCCDPSEEDVLKYTIKELNQILADGIINVSVRFAQNNELFYTDIAGAVQVIPEKYRTPLRILTFLNNSHKPEIWMYTGDSPEDFGNMNLWIRLYRPDTNIHGGYSNTDYANS